jgi:hypothetical protein
MQLLPKRNTAGIVFAAKNSGIRYFKTILLKSDSG